MLPDGAPLGSALGGGLADVGAPTVVLLPGGAVPTWNTEPLGLLPSVSVLEVPPPWPPTVQERGRERLLSVSHRLSALLGSEPTPQQMRKAGRAGRSTRCAARGAELLKGSKAVVLRQVDALTQAVLQHILEDTVAALGASSGPAPSAPEVVAAWPAVKASHGPSLAQQAAQEAERELARVEAELLRRYWREVPSGPSASASSAWASSSKAMPSLPTAAAPPKASVLLPAHRAGAAAGTSSVGAEPTGWLRPAALPLDRVREIEDYRMRFARHCLATREAGIDDGIPPGQPASRATWLIWPYLADCIAMAAVEEAIEETHAAMERHVDELVREEMAGSYGAAEQG